MTDRDPFQTLWTDQKEEPFTMSLADVRARATRFQSRIRTRNFIEYAAAALVIGVFGWMAWLIPEPAVKAGAVLIILGALYVCWKLHALAGAESVSGPDTASSLAEFHRAQLVRQRTALASVWQWYLAPFVPGMLVFILGTSLSADTNLPMAARLVSAATSLGMGAAIFGTVWWLNQRVVKRLDREIAEIDAARVIS